MPSSTTRTVGPAVNTVDYSALESLEAINHRLTDGGITFHLSEVKGPVMDRLKRSHFLEDRINQAVADNPAVRHVILVCPAVNTIDASALESLEAINHRLKDGGITFHLSEVKGPVMDRLKRSHFLEELTGKVHLTQFDAVSSIKPDLALRTLEARRSSNPQRDTEKESGMET